MKVIVILFSFTVTLKGSSSAAFALLFRKVELEMVLVAEELER
jgi:hypothetical protein